MKKKLLLSLLCILTAFITKAQFSNNIPLNGSNVNTRQISNGGVWFKKLIQPPTFIDTSAANNGDTEFYPGSIIFTSSDNSFWYRNAAATQWIRFQSGSASDWQGVMNNGNTSNLDAILTNGAALAFYKNGDDVTQYLRSYNFGATGSLFLPDTEDSSTLATSLSINGADPVFANENGVITIGTVGLDLYGTTHLGDSTDTDIDIFAAGCLGPGSDHLLIHLTQQGECGGDSENGEINIYGYGEDEDGYTRMRMTPTDIETRDINGNRYGLHFPIASQLIENQKVANLPYPISSPDEFTLATSASIDGGTKVFADAEGNIDLTTAITFQGLMNSSTDAVGAEGTVPRSLGTGGVVWDFVVTGFDSATMAATTPGGYALNAIETGALFLYSPVDFIWHQLMFGSGSCSGVTNYYRDGDSLRLTLTNGDAFAVYAPTSSVNIYNSDGTLTGDRILDGLGKSFTIQNTHDITLSPTNGYSLFFGSATSDINLQSGTGNVILTTSAPLLINGDAGTAGQVLTSNGAANANTWEDAAAVIPTLQQVTDVGYKTDDPLWAANLILADTTVTGITFNSDHSLVAGILTTGGTVAVDNGDMVFASVSNDAAVTVDAANGFFIGTADGTGTQINVSGNGAGVIGKSENAGIMSVLANGSLGVGIADGDSLVTGGVGSISVGKDIVSENDYSYLFGTGLRNYSDAPTSAALFGWGSRKFGIFPDSIIADIPEESATGLNAVYITPSGRLIQDAAGGVTPGIDDVLAVGQAFTNDRPMDINGFDYTISNTGVGTMGKFYGNGKVDITAYNEGLNLKATGATGIVIEQTANSNYIDLGADGAISIYSTNSADVSISAANDFNVSATTSNFTGAVKISDGTQDNGYVFTSDALGLGSWQPTLSAISYFTPTTGTTITSVKGTNIIEPAGTLATLTVDLPASPSNGDIVVFSFTEIVTALTVSGNGHTIKGAPATTNANGTAAWIYRTATDTYYKWQ